MSDKSFAELVKYCRETVSEVMPWDLIDLIAKKPNQLILDVREQNEFDAMHIETSIHIPRGLLEAACEFASGIT